MKYITTILTTLILFIHIGYAQSRYDCTVYPNKKEYTEFIKNENNINVKFINEFINEKKIEKEKLLKITKAEDGNQINDFKKYSELIDSIPQIFDFELNLNDSEYKLTRSQVIDINKIITILKRNISFTKDADSKKLYPFDSTILKIEISSKYIKNPNDSTKTVEVFYKVKKEQYNKFVSVLSTINHSMFNQCNIIIQQNIDNINDDINNAEALMNELTIKEIKIWNFKSNITLIVGILLALILVCFFIGVFHNADNSVKQKLIGETGLQFITIFVIIIAVILFGVMEILKGSELAAILSAIAGYILGKATPPKSEKLAELELELEKLKMEKLKSNEEKEESNK